MASYRTLACPFCGFRSFNICQNVDDNADMVLSCADCGMDHPSYRAATGAPQGCAS